ncbi:hypothetical protein RhiirA1_467378 [Rhizophagus irregularis]|uniref:Serine-threonine/tyrosine-protein kinase catalytic domain-containing protein n=1 Tax=Rhizophagus irregularis TaxID=588596 RepID=A0A2N0RC68_9GLOM|nr:hypothetical protein RhiirA1_467378 [Rhizophagus irregularis]
MNELMSEEIAFNDIPHDRTLAVKICKGLRPKITEDTPKLIADLIIKCWDAKAENRPAAKELFQLLRKYFDELNKEVSEIYSQIKECEKIKVNKLKNRTNENKSKNIQTHPQAIYTSRLLNFKNLPEPVNSTDYLSSFQEPVSSTSENPISECLDYELNEFGGFSKIYSADWSEGNIEYWDIENQKWDRTPNVKVALKSLDNSSKISNDFLNEIKYYISGHFSCFNTAICYGITQDPDTRNYMMVLQYYENGDLRNNLMNDLEYRHKIINLYWIIDGLLAIHDAGKLLVI